MLTRIRQSFALNPVESWNLTLSGMGGTLPFLDPPGPPKFTPDTTRRAASGSPLFDVLGLSQPGPGYGLYGPFFARHAASSSFVRKLVGLPDPSVTTAILNSSCYFSIYLLN